VREQKRYVHRIRSGLLFVSIGVRVLLTLTWVLDVAVPAELFAVRV
jgi:hypothetical protein